MKTAYEMDSKVKELRDIQSMIDELTAEAEAIKDTLKAKMVELGDDEISGNGWKATWHTVTSSRLDTKALKAGAPDVYALYTKASTTSRFVLA